MSELNDDVASDLPEKTQNIETDSAAINLDNAVNDYLGEAVDPSEPQTQNAVTVTDAAQSLEGLLSFIPIGLNAVGYQKTAEVWHETARRNIAVASIPVMRKYAWGLRFINFLEGGTGIHEAALFFAVYPVAMATMSAIELDKAALNESTKPVNTLNDLPPLDMTFEPEVFGTNRKA